MYDQSNMMYIYVETPLHAGSGRAVGVVDLPIQRERVTNYPLVQSSGVKGRLRAEARDAKMNPAAIEAIFGPETNNADAYAGAISVGDARILLFPVRSLYGVFVWATSANVLARYARDLTAAGIAHNLVAAIKGLPSLRDVNGSKVAVSAAGKKLHGDTAVLEEFSYATVPYAGEGGIDYITTWLADNVLPTAPEYDYWRTILPERLVILPEDDFRDFVTNSTEVVTRVKLNNDTKTVENGMLWTEESLPSDTLLYAPLYMVGERKGAELRKKDNGDKERDAQPAAALMKLLTAAMNNHRIRLGGDETVGRGSVALRFVAGGPQQ